MAIIYSYPQFAPKPEDLLIGTVTLDENAVVPIYDNPTVSFTIQSLLDMIAPITGAQNLQQVTNIGATTTNAITFSSDISVTGRFFDSSGSPGVAGQVLSSTVTGTSWIVNSPASVTSVGLSMPAAFSVANSPITTAGTLAVTGAGSALQYINGLGNLVTFPTIPTQYVLPLAANGTRGGIQIGYTSAGKNYAVQLSSEKAFVNVPWTDTPYTLPVATSSDLGGVKIGYTDNAKNYAVELDSDQMYVNVPWTDTPYVLPLAADGTRGGVQIGYTQTATRDYPVTLDSEKMLVTVPWTDTQNPNQTLLGTGSDNSDSGIILNESGGTVLVLGAGSITAAQTSNTITLTGINTWVANAVTVAGYVAAPAATDANLVWKTNASGEPAWRADADTDTGITGVTLAINSTGTWTVPLSESITGRELTLTSNVYGGGAKVGFVPTGGTSSLYLKGDGTWAAVPTGLQFKGTWDASGGGGGSPDLTQAGNKGAGFLWICDDAGTAYPNGGSAAPSTWALGDWCIYDGTAWTRVPATNAGVTSVTTTDGTYIDLTPASPTTATGPVTVTADLSAQDGSSDTSTKFLSKDNTWDVPSYTTDTNTQNIYTNSWQQSTNDIILRKVLSGAGSGTQDIKIVKGANITFTYTDADNFTIAATDTNTTYTAGNGLNLSGTVFSADVNNTQANSATTALSATAGRFYAVQLDNNATIANADLVVNVPWTDTDTQYSAMTSTVLGLGKLFSDTEQTVVATAVSAITSRTYGVQMNSDSQLVINVPWVDTDTTYSAMTTSTLGLGKIRYDVGLTPAAEDQSTTASRTYGVTKNASDQLIVNVPWVSGGSYNWKLNSQTSGSTQTIASGDTVDFKGAGGITVSRSTASNVTTTLFTGTTYSVMGSGNSYAAGLVLAGSATNGGNFLRKDGTWQVPPNTQYSDFTVSTGSAPGTAGLVPAPAAGTQGGTYYLNGDKSFSVPPGTYSLPLAASGTRGGVQIGYTESGKNYPVELSSEKMFVNVPWTDNNDNTTYSIDVPAATTNINLKGANPTSNDAIALTPSTGISIIRNSDSQLTFSQAASINVTVASSSGSNKYFLDGVLQADAIIKPNFVYRFDQSSATNSSHPLRFSSDSANATPYTTGVTAVGTPGSAGAYTQIITTQATPYLYYYCTSHSGMGGAVPLQVNKITNGQGITVGPSTGDGNVTLSVARATNTANGGLRIGYTAIGTRDYALLLDSNGEGYVNVPWTDSGDTGITGVTLATGTSTGAPLTESIASRELTLTSMVYAGAANVGYVPPGGTATTFLRGDATWQVPPTGPNDNYYVDGASYATGTLTLTRTGSLGSLTATGFLQVGTAATDAMAGNTTTISTAQAANIVTNNAKVSMVLGTTAGTALAGNTVIPQGDITNVTAGTDLSGGGASGSVTLNNTSTLATVCGRGSTTGTSITMNGSGANGYLYVTGNAATTAPTNVQGLAFAYNNSGGSRENEIFFNPGTVTPAENATYYFAIINQYLNSSSSNARTTDTLFKLYGNGNLELTGPASTSTIANTYWRMPKSAAPGTGYYLSKHSSTIDLVWTAPPTTGDVTGITVSNGITGSSLSGPIPAISMSGTYTGDLTITGDVVADSYRFRANHANPTTSTATLYDQANVGATISAYRFAVRNSDGTNMLASALFTDTSLTVVGDVIAFGSPSDVRLKENIKPIESALDKVTKLQGVTFDWKKSDSILDIKEDIGFIAQDVQKVIPELVKENKDGILSMRHQGIAPILLEAIKELKAEIEKLKLNKCNCNK